MVEPLIPATRTCLPRSSTAPGAARRPAPRLGVGSTPAPGGGVPARVPDPPSERRPGSGRYRAPPLGRPKPPDNLGRLSGRHYPVLGGEEVLSQLRARGLEPTASGRRPDPPARGPCVGDGGVSWRALHPHRGRVGGGHDRPATAPPGLPPIPLRLRLRLPDPQLRQRVDHSYWTFGRTFDLFGDGSVRLASTPGDSAGHHRSSCACPARLRDRRGAAYDWRQLRGAPARDDGRRAQLAPLAAGAPAYRRTYPYALMVPGHDPEFWEKLEPRYEE